MESSSPAKTPGDKNDTDKMFRDQDIHGEDGAQGGETARYVDELFQKNCGASPGRSPSSPLTRKVYPKLARWADPEFEEDVPDMSEEMQATRENRRRAALSAEGWSEG